MSSVPGSTAGCYIHFIHFEFKALHFPVCLLEKAYGRGISLCHPPAFQTHLPLRSTSLWYLSAAILLFHCKQTRQVLAVVTKSLFSSLQLTLLWSIIDVSWVLIYKPFTIHRESSVFPRHGGITSNPSTRETETGGHLGCVSKPLLHAPGNAAAFLFCRWQCPMGQLQLCPRTFPGTDCFPSFCSFVGPFPSLGKTFYF